ncbi:MAG TPA: sulfotransferase [Thiothrix sp.]|nr:sulfotransferase [Thiothrix sp.]
MLISNTHSFIFFHVAKVAGISIREALMPYTQEPQRFRMRRPPRTINGKANALYEIWESVLLHATAQQTQKALPDAFNHYYKFAFVRNPWDWQISMYHFLLKQTQNTHYDLIKSFPSFRHYLEWVVSEKKPFPKGATKLQKTMLVDNKGNLMVDYIGRFENLQQDFQSVAQHLGIQANLPKRNTSNHRNYPDYYDSYTKKLVGIHFAEDIDLFEYTFD